MVRRRAHEPWLQLKGTPQHKEISVKAEKETMRQANKKKKMHEAGSRHESLECEMRQPLSLGRKIVVAEVALQCKMGVNSASESCR
jgi:hypothetical protein